jgi:hypothetical protein
MTRLSKKERADRSARMKPPLTDDEFKLRQLEYLDRILQNFDEMNASLERIEKIADRVEKWIPYLAKPAKDTKS